MWIDDRHLEIINIGLEVIRKQTMDMPLHLKMRDLRIHQIVDALTALSAPAPAVPDEIAETIRCALNETAEDIGMNPAFYADPYEAMRKVEAALSWLAQHRAVPSSGTA